MKKIFCFGVFILMGLCFLCSCSKEDIDSELAGDAPKFGNPAPAYYCGYRSKTKEFDIDSVELYFYYYTIFSDPSYYNYEGYNITLEIYCSTLKNTEKYLIKTYTPDEFFNDGYTQNSIIFEGKPFERKMHYEKIQIPVQLFAQDEGIILFNIEALWEYIDGSVSTGSRNYAYIYYKKNDGKVILSDEEF